MSEQHNHSPLRGVGYGPSHVDAPTLADDVNCITRGYGLTQAELDRLSVEVDAAKTQRAQYAGCRYAVPGQHEWFMSKVGDPTSFAYAEEDFVGPDHVIEGK